MITRRFWNWVDDRQIVRRCVIWVTIYMTWEAGVHGWAFAKVSTFDGIGTAAVIASITAPLAVLQKSAFEAYMSLKPKSE